MKKIVLSICLLCCISAHSKPQTVTIHLLETSDVHGSFFPYDFITLKPKRGTLARISTYVNRLRQETSGNVILLDNGDILQGQPTCYFYNYVNTQEENIAASVINYLSYDAETIGNHDIETGHSVYDKWIKEVTCPMLGANIINTTTNEPYVKPYTIVERQGIRIAILGMLTPAIPNWLQPNIWSGLQFEEMVSCAQKWVKIIKEAEKPDLIVGLFHSGKDGGIVTSEYAEDASLQVAKEVSGFDVIFFGHDHTRHNSTVTNRKGNEVLFLNPANNALAVAQADVTFEKKNGRWKVVKKEGKVVDVTKEEIDQQYIQHFQSQLDKIMAFVNRQIGVLEETITTRDCFFGSSAFTDLILNLQLELTGADIAFNAPLQFNSTIKAGPIRVSDMFNLYKFENQLYVMRLTGEEIRRHLEMSYDLWVNTMQSPDDHLLLLSESTFGDQQRLGFKNFSFNFDSAAGIDYVVDVTKPDGQKVKILQMSNGEAFDETKWYCVALNSYRANGGGELLTRGAGIKKEDLNERIIYRSERDQRFYLMQEIEKKGTIHPKSNNNWRFIPEEWVQPAAKRDSLILFGKKQ